MSGGSEAQSGRQGGVALWLRLLGPMQATAADGRSVLPLGRKTRALLAILALAAPRAVSRAHLAELLWSRRHEEQARASLRQEIHRLLEALLPVGDTVLRVTRDHVALRAERIRLDVRDMLGASQEDPSALSLLDDELLSEFDATDPALDQWLAAERARLRGQARVIALAMLDEHAAPEAVLRAASRLTTIDPAHEGAWRAVMRAHAALGERGLAVQAYERCRAALAELMQAQPAAETQRLIGEIRAGTVPAGPAPQPETPAPQRSPARVGMLPLQSIEAGQDHLALSVGLAEEVTVALARFRWLALVSSSALAQAGTRDAAALRQRLGLDFLLDGSVHGAGSRLRVALRLLDLRAGNLVVWARHFDCGGDDVLQVEDDIAAEVAAQIDAELLLLEGRRAAGRPADDNSAYDMVLRALPMTVRLRKDEFFAAGDLFARAQEAEPTYAGAFFWRSYWAVFCLDQGWAEHPRVVLAMAEDSADRAVTLDPQDARGLTIAGHVRAHLFGCRREALELHARALALNPNLAMAWGMSAMTYTAMGDLDEAARRYDRYVSLAPTDPNAFFFDMGRATLALHRRDYQAAVDFGRRASELNPFYAPALQVYLSALGHAGWLGEAKGVLRRLLTIDPAFTLATPAQRTPSAQRAMMEHFVAGLRVAGLTEAPAEADATA